jgi:GH15 family glucan-1,4-alpha-glucosidase
VSAWAAVDGVLSLHDSGDLLAARIDRAPLERTRAQLRDEIERRGFSPSLGSYTTRLDGDDVDAVLLRIPFYGFEPASSRRMRGTHARIVAELAAGDALLYRNRGADSPGDEGAFGICSFWRAEYLALAGAVDEAERLFARLLEYANDVGLYAEEIDPDSGDALGNFPQAFTHVGLINAALTIDEQRRALDENARTRAIPASFGGEEAHP